MLKLLNGFVVELRNAGLPVSLTENLDAMEAVQHIPIEDREAFKYALGATLIKNHAHWRSFDTVFEVYFSLRGPEYKIGDGDGDSDIDEMWREMQEQQQNADGNGGQGGMDGMTPEEIAQMLMQALMNGDQGMMRAMAKQSVQRFAGMEPGRPVGGTYYLYRTLRNLDLDSMLEKMMDQSREDAPDDLTTLEERLEKEEYSDRIEKFKGEIEAEIRRRLVADRGAEAMAKTLRKPLPEDVEFMHASRDEMVSLKKSLQPLTRKLAARLARKRKHGRKGPLDFRSTVRHSPQLRRRASGASIQISPSIQARVDGYRRHLRLGCSLCSVHPDAGVCDLGPVFEGPLVRFHRWSRRSDRLLQVDRRHFRSYPSRQH